MKHAHFSTGSTRTLRGPLSLTPDILPGWHFLTCAYYRETSAKPQQYYTKTSNALIKWKNPTHRVRRGPCIPWNRTVEQCFELSRLQFGKFQGLRARPAFLACHFTSFFCLLIWCRTWHGALNFMVGSCFQHIFSCNLQKMWIVPQGSCL